MAKKFCLLQADRGNILAKKILKRLVKKFADSKTNRIFYRKNNNSKKCETGKISMINKTDAHLSSNYYPQK